MSVYFLTYCYQNIQNSLNITYVLLDLNKTCNNLLIIVFVFWYFVNFQQDGFLLSCLNVEIAVISMLIHIKRHILHKHTSFWEISVYLIRYNSSILNFTTIQIGTTLNTIGNCLHTLLYFDQSPIRSPIKLLLVNCESSVTNTRIVKQIPIQNIKE